MIEEKRKGFELWDKFQSLQKYSFWRGDEDEKGSVIRVPNEHGRWIDYQEAIELVDAFNDEFERIKSENEALRERQKIKSVK